MAHKHKTGLRKNLDRKTISPARAPVKKPIARKKRIGKKAAPKRHAHHAKTHPLRRVVYASPLCEERTPGINNLIGLDDLPTQIPVVATGLTTTPNEIFNLPPILVGGGGPAGPGFPGGPLFPGVSIVILPPLGPGGPGNPVNPGGPDTPPVVTPSNPAGLPEPASWVIMIFGMGLVGGVLRRRRAIRRSAI